jgi:serine/threonine-protein kinase HipA
MSISGVQIKASVKLSPDEKTFEVVSEGGTHILKPEPTEFPELPENENLIMNMAHELKMPVPPHGLFSMADGKLCYIIKRFDRLPNGRKMHKEDMAQLLGFSAERKYSGSLEAVGKIILKHTADSHLELFDFFQRVVFNFAIGNGDMHLKNWSLMTPETGRNTLTPCYDFVSSKIYIPGEDDFALPMGGKNTKLKRGDFKKFAEYLGLDVKAAVNAINSVAESKLKFLDMVSGSLLSQERREKLAMIIEERMQRL